jgi:N-acetylglutamate synthase-like GNAT family acetyltransferase
MIRPARIEDAGSVARIGACAAEIYEDLLKDSDTFFLVSIEGSQVVAFILGSLDDKSLFVSQIATDQRFRLKGHGRALLDGALAAARDKGVCVSLGTRTPAFFERCGFKITRRDGGVYSMVKC